MKDDEMKLLRAMDGIGDSMLLDAMPEQYGEKRPIRHILNARHKALWAAAIAAVIGLNIFAVMQLRGSLRSPGANTTVYPASLPDLSAFGIGNSFELKSTDYTDADQFDSAYRWYYEGNPPTEGWTLYENKDGAQLVYDRQGRLRRFFNRPEIRDLVYFGDPEQMDCIVQKDTTGLSLTARNFMRTLFPDDPAADEISIFQNWVGDDYYYSDFIELSDGTFGNIYVTEENEIRQLHLSRDLGDTEPEPSNSEKRRIEKAAKKLIEAVAYQGEGEIIEQHYEMISGKYYGFFDVLMGESADGHPPAYGTYYLLIDPDGIVRDECRRSSEEYSYPDAPEYTGTEATTTTAPPEGSDIWTGGTTTIPQTGGDRIMTLDDVRALAEKGDALRWDDFSPFIGEDVSDSSKRVWKYDLSDFCLIVSGSERDKEPRTAMLSCGIANLPDGTREIDIRTENAAAFITRCYAAYLNLPDPHRVTVQKDYGLEWINLGFDYDLSPFEIDETIMLSTEPALLFSYQKGEKLEILRDGKVIKTLTGLPIWKVFFMDINGDGYAEVCTEVSFGSGMVDEHIEVYDYHNDRSYTLWDRGEWDYYLEAGNPELHVTRTKYNTAFSQDTDEVHGIAVLKDGALQFEPLPDQPVSP